MSNSRGMCSLGSQVDADLLMLKDEIAGIDIRLSKRLDIGSKKMNTIFWMGIVTVILSVVKIGMEVCQGFGVCIVG